MTQQELLTLEKENEVPFPLIYFSKNTTLPGMADRELSKAQAAREIGITLEGVRRAIKSGYLKTIQRGPFQLVLASSVEYYKNHRPKPGTKPGTKLGPRKKKE